MEVTEDVMNELVAKLTERMTEAMEELKDRAVRDLTVSVAERASGESDLVGGRREPQIPDTARYSGAEVAKILGVSPRTVANYVQRGLLACGRHRHNGRRFFTGREIKRFWRCMM